jgi:hypothetical protein
MRGAFRWGLIAALAAMPALAQAPLPPAAAPSPALGASAERQGDARTQQALRRVLGVLMGQYGDLTGKVPESLNDADIAMRNAVQALDAGDDAAAAAAIQKAIAALQKGGRSMSQQLSQQFGRQPDQGDDADGDEGDDGNGQMTGEADGRGSGPQDSRSGGWSGHRSADRRDPLGRPLREDGTGQSPADSGVRVPEQMEQARSRAIQEELRRREAEKNRPQPELDYLERLLQQF